MGRFWSLTILALGVTAVASAEDSFRHGRIRHVEDGVTIQRAAEAAAEEALQNLPFLPGDRLWTDGQGRAEFQFAGAAVLRLDNGTKLDYLAHEEGRGSERIVLRLWSGSVYLHVRERRSPDFDIETPGGLVNTRTRGVYRVDSDGGETRVSVFEGEAVLEGAAQERVRAGERVVARGGEIVEGPDDFDRANGDGFAAWVDDRQERVAVAGERPSHLPEEVSDYADEFESHGSWYHEPEVGHVWRPYVAAGWRPYVSGRWVWTVYGWTWVGHEPWGWAPYHYGRWGFSPVIGWYWIPGNSWGPAWVSWAVGPSYVGWCPLGYRDKPVLFQRGRTRGHAVPRGSLSTGKLDASGAWVYARLQDVGSGRSLSKVAQFQPPAEEIRLVERGAVGKDFGPVPSAPAGVPRSGRTKATMGDSVPEMRSDHTAIPFPSSRHRRDGERYDRQSFGEAAATDATKRAPRGAVTRSEASAPADSTAAPARRGREARTGDAAAQPAARPARESEEREVLRPIFQGLNRPRGGSGEGRADADAGRRSPPPDHGTGEGRRGGMTETRPRSEHPPQREGARTQSPPPRQQPQTQEQPRKEKH